MSKIDVSRYTKKFHKTLIDSDNPRYNRIRAAVAGDQAYFTGKPCKNGHVDWRNTSTGHCKTCIRDYFKSNPKAYHDKTKGWVEKNPEKRKNVLRRHGAKRRGKKAGREAVYQVAELQTLMVRQNKKCANCKTSIARKYHADHIMPLARGGSNDIKNIQLLCPSCNLKKWAKDPIVWARENGRLL